MTMTTEREAIAKKAVWEEDQSCGAPALGAAKLLGIEVRTTPTDDELRVMRLVASPDEPAPQEPDGSDDYATCLALQRRGLVYTSNGMRQGREVVLFDLTDKGHEALAAALRSGG